MAEREEIKRQHHIPEDDLDDVLEIAQRLQHAEQAAKPTVSTADVESIASELSIAPRYVEQAVAELRAQRERQEAAREAAVEGRRKLQRTIVATAAGVVLLVGALGGVGAIGVSAAEQRAASAQSALEVVVDRQLALLPQLVALSGGQVGSLGRYEVRLREARSVPEKLAVSRELSAQMAAKIGQLPPSADPSAAQQRLSLQHEVVGMQNRITTEQRRYQEAVTAWRNAAGSPTGRIAVSLGMARRPPE